MSTVPQRKCLTPDHEVFTIYGWKPIAEVEFRDEILGWDPLTADIGFVAVQDTYEFMAEYGDWSRLC